jgi:8-oxo-dGTP pyrophosphatase MutT (NUDIX family)
MYPVSIKGVLFSTQCEVILLLNEREEWELPGGRIELGESSTECLARETFEELNIRARVALPLDTYLFEVVPGKHVFVATYPCELIGPFSPTLSREHKRIGLFPPNSLPQNLPSGFCASIETVRTELSGATDA